MQTGIFLRQLFIHLFEIKILFDVGSPLKNCTRNAVGRIKESGALVLVIFYNQPETDKFQEDEEKERSEPV